MSNTFLPEGGKIEVPETCGSSSRASHAVPRGQQAAAAQPDESAATPGPAAGAPGAPPLSVAEIYELLSSDDPDVVSRGIPLIGSLPPDEELRDQLRLTVMEKEALRLRLNQSERRLGRTNERLGRARGRDARGRDRPPAPAREALSRLRRPARGRRRVRPRGRRHPRAAPAPRRRSGQSPHGRTGRL